MSKPQKVFRTFAGHALLILFLFCCAPSAFSLEPLTRVRLFDAHPRLKSVLIEGPVLIEPLGRILPSVRLVADGSRVLLLAPGGSSKTGAARFQFLRLKPQSGSGSRCGSGIAVTPADGGRCRHYRGILIATASGGSLRIVNEVDTRSYITAVVGSESLPDFPLEALKAQTVLACTTRARLGDNFVGDSTAVQAYLGSDYERPPVKKAVASVYGQLLGRNKKMYPRAVYYHSTCAGSTSDALEVFSGKSEKQSERVLCTNCRQSPFFAEHSQVLKLAEIRSRLGFVPQKVLAVDAAGRPLQVLISGNSSKGRQEKISGYQLWLKLGQNFGWGAVPGMRYRFEQTPGNLVFVSSGAGHGAGLCQWGAAGLAKRGKDYKEILRFYFPDACLLLPEYCSLSGKGPGN